MKVACVGILVADVIVEPVGNYPEKGVLEPVNSITVHNGGNAMTAAINLKKMGGDSAMFGMVGKDMMGDYLEKRLAEEGVDTCGLVKSDKAQTSSSVLMIDKEGQRSFFHCRGANGVFSVEDIDFAEIEKCDMVFVTGSFIMDTFDGVQTMEFLKKCKEMGKTTFLDVCWDATGRWGELLDMSMPYIDYLMPSIDEAVNISGRDNPDEIADVFMSKGAENVVVKLGKDGAFLRRKGEEKGTVYPCYNMGKVVDTTGAGDSFCSGFLAAYSMGKSPEECMLFGNMAGSLNVTEKGATTAARHIDEMEKLIMNYK